MALQYFSDAQKDPRALPLQNLDSDGKIRKNARKEQLLWSDF